jgi:transcriptional repressor NrdR
MICPFCGSEQSNVIDKRAVRSSGEIRRRRACLKCKARYTTYERVMAVTLQVIKRDGRREAFDIEKIKKGLRIVLEKRENCEKIEEIAGRIERKIRCKNVSEVRSKAIGMAVLAELKKIDEVAYLRFASVYRHFESATDFAKAIQTFN